MAKFGFRNDETGQQRAQRHRQAGRVGQRGHAQGGEQGERGEGVGLAVGGDLVEQRAHHTPADEVERDHGEHALERRARQQEGKAALGGA